MKNLPTMILICSFLFLGCQDNDDSKVEFNADATVDAAKEYAVINEIFQDIGNISGDGILEAENSSAAKVLAKTVNDRPEITVEPADLTTFPKTITLDFKSGTLCKDGITRKGIIRIISTGWYRDLGSEHTTSFDHFYHENYLVEGTHFVKNIGLNGEDQLQFSVHIEDGKITSDKGDHISYSENSVRTWISGFDSPLYIWDDEYMLEGMQSGNSSQGIAYTLTIEEPLHFVLLPREIKSGIIDLDLAKIKDIKVDFGNSTITILGVTYPFIP